MTVQSMNIYFFFFLLACFFVLGITVPIWKQIFSLAYDSVARIVRERKRMKLESSLLEKELAGVLSDTPSTGLGDNNNPQGDMEKCEMATLNQLVESFGKTVRTTVLNALTGEIFKNSVYEATKYVSIDIAKVIDRSEKRLADHISDTEKKLLERIEAIETVVQTNQSLDNNVSFQLDEQISSFDDIEKEDTPVVPAELSFASLVSDKPTINDEPVEKQVIVESKEEKSLSLPSDTKVTLTVGQDGYLQKVEREASGQFPKMVCPVLRNDISSNPSTGRIAGYTNGKGRSMYGLYLGTTTSGIVLAPLTTRFLPRSKQLTTKTLDDIRLLDNVNQTEYTPNNEQTKEATDKKARELLEQEKTNKKSPPLYNPTGNIAAPSLAALANAEQANIEKKKTPRIRKAVSLNPDIPRDLAVELKKPVRLLSTIEKTTRRTHEKASYTVVYLKETNGNWEVYRNTDGTILEVSSDSNVSDSFFTNTVEGYTPYRKMQY